MYSGITSFLVLFMWFTKAVDDFNDDIKKNGSNAPQLIASTSNGFISTSSLGIFIVTALTLHSVVWVGFAFYAVPLVSALSKLHVLTAGGKA